ncbi:MAG: hypothetical protein GWN30_32595 [Gammaproteobacteria bacterium]|nr:hypothetical protein [Gammaproteobacteria bacterium]
MNSKMNQKEWMSVVIWVGLLAGTAYTSNATVNVFNAIIQALFSTLQGGISDLFSNYGVLFAVILGIVLIFLIVSAWLGFVSYTFEVGSYVFGGSEDEEDEEEFVSEMSALPGQVVRYLGFSWGLFFILFLILPMVM